MTCQSAGLGIKRFVCTRVPGHILTGYSQPSCPAPPSAQAEWTVLGPAGRHVRRLAQSLLIAEMYCDPMPVFIELSWSVPRPVEGGQVWLTDKIGLQ
jgi:hypothetical protein